MAKVSIKLPSGKFVRDIEETTPGLFGRLGYEYIDTQPPKTELSPTKPLAPIDKPVPAVKIPSIETPQMRIEREAKPFDEAAYRAQERERRIAAAQSRFESIEKEFQHRLTREREETEKQRERERNLASVFGLAGSTVLEERIGKVEERGRERERRLGDIKAAQIQSVYAEIDELVETASVRERKLALAQTKEEEARIREEQSRQAQALILGLASEGVSLRQSFLVDRENTRKLIEVSGMHPFEINQMWNAMLPQPNKFEHIMDRRGNIVEKEIGPDGRIVSAKTYPAEELGLPKEIDPHFITIPGVGVYYLDKENPTAGVHKIGELPLSPLEQASLDKIYSELGVDSTTDITGLTPEARQILNNPSLLEHYTPTEKGRILNEIARAGGAAQTVAQESSLRVARNALEIAQELKEMKYGLRQAAGVTGPLYLIPGSPGRQFLHKMDTLRARLTLPYLEFARGLGRMSQEQFRALEAASSVFGARGEGLRDLSNAAVRRELDKVIDNLNEYIQQTELAGPASVPLQITDEDYQEYLQTIGQ
jgi:hypothetical protein